MKKRSKTYFLLVFIVIFITFLRIGLTIYQQKEKFFAVGYSERHNEYKKEYYSSQYVSNSPVIIGDDTLEIFAAGAFLRGMNPILIVHDHPPLARYLVAGSLLFFDNPHILMIPLLLAALIGLILIGYEIFKNLLIALIPVTIFANEPLLLIKFIDTPLLEPIQFPFIVFAFYFFIKGITGKRYLGYFIALSCMLGFVISTRFFVTGAAIVGCMMLVLLLDKKLHKRILLFILLLPIAVAILLLSYTRTMLDGYNIIQIFGIQKYILLYHKSKFILPFTYWDLLFFNRWHTWWGDRAISYDPKWVIFWPISMLLTMGNIFLSFIHKIPLTAGEKILTVWILVYSLMLSTGYTSTNYFLPVIPFLYILATACVVKVFGLVKRR